VRFPWLAQARQVFGNLLVRGVHFGPFRKDPQPALCVPLAQVATGTPLGLWRVFPMAWGDTIVC
jgi:hypothetical protein